MKFDKDTFYNHYWDVNDVEHYEMRKKETEKDWVLGTEKPSIIVANAFGIYTYDDGIDEFVGDCIIETLNVLKEKKWTRHIANDEKYKIFVIVNNLLDFNDMIDWGTSIRSAWLTEKGEETLELINKFLNQWDGD